MVDPLSQILALLRPRSAISVGLDLAGDWSFLFPKHEGLKFNAVMKGSCWLRLEGDQTWQHLEAGDCFLLTSGLPFQLASDKERPAADPASLYRDAAGPVISVNGGGELLLIGGRFALAEDYSPLLLAALAPVFIVRRNSTHAEVLHFALGQFATELDSANPGGSLVAEHLAQVMLVHLLRIYLAQASPEATGWMGALGDIRLSRALAAIHAQPARDWSLSELALMAGMSRTSFAQAFKRKVGQSPIDYLANWRMLLARDRLRQGKTTIATVAAEVGYTSEAAFSTAFKRIVGLSPRQVRRSVP
jgi:AraC-like DNA-binding protein/uncharacterized protein YaiE (UPF0345 family)